MIQGYGLWVLGYSSTMTYFEPTLSYTAPKTPQRQSSWLTLAVMRLCVMGVCFLLGLSRDEMIARMMPAPPLGRAQKRMEGRKARRTIPPGRDLGALRPLIPRALGAPLSPTQRLERYTRLVAMSRFQVYNFLYYRHDFWRIGAVKARARAPLGASGLMLMSEPCGLSAAHAWPD